MAHKTRDTRRRFEQWVNNPECEANTISAVHDVSMKSVVKKKSELNLMEQSPFAIMRGNKFENGLFLNSAQRLINALKAAREFTNTEVHFLDLRIKMNSGPLANLDTSKEKTAEFLKSLASKPVPGAQYLVAGPTVLVPGNAMIPETIFVIDALSVRVTQDTVLLKVGEIKSFQDRGGYTKGANIASARAQAGIYAHGLDIFIKQECKIEVGLTVSSTGILIFNKPATNLPSVRASEDLTYQIKRAERGFQKLLKVADDLKKTPESQIEQEIEAAEMNYTESCLSFCERAHICFEKAKSAGHGKILGSDMARFLGPTSLHRAVELIEGQLPKNDNDREFLSRYLEAMNAEAAS